MSKVILSIPKLGVTDKGWEKNKEIYVVSFVADLNTNDKKALPGVIAAYNETLPNMIAPNVMAESALKYVVVNVSNIFSRIRADQPVSLSGSGILLYPNLDPNGLLASHFVIIESDQKVRNFGDKLKALLTTDSVASIVTRLEAGVTQPLLASLLNAIITEVPNQLMGNKDDLLFSHSHSGFDFDNYGCDEPDNTQDFLLGNDLANCTLRVKVRA